MDIKNILNLLNRVKKSFDICERRPGKYQLMAPILHEDGDMIDIYLQNSPKGDNYIRICDFGMSLMRLSYNYEVNKPARKKIFNSILLNNGIQNDQGNLYLDSHLDKLHESIFQFAGCVQKVCSMDYWNRAMPHSAFYEDLKSFILKELEEFSPKPNVTPLQNYKIITVDWSLKYRSREFYLFGVRGNDKAKNAAIALLEFKKVMLSFTSLIVHENMENLGEKERIYLTKNADTQYPSLSDFNDDGIADIKRLAS